MFSNKEQFSAYLCEKITSWLSAIQSNRLTIADIGAGAGLLTHYLANSFLNSTIIGIDIDKEKIAQAAQQFPHQIFIHINEINNHLKQSSCDIVLITLTLHHVQKPERQAFLDKARSLLKPNGTLIIIEFNPYTLFSKKELCKVLIKPKEVRRMLSDMNKKLIYFGYPRPFDYGETFFFKIPFGSLYAIVAQKTID